MMELLEARRVLATPHGIDVPASVIDAPAVVVPLDGGDAAGPLVAPPTDDVVVTDPVAADDSTDSATDSTDSADGTDPASDETDVSAAADDPAGGDAADNSDPSDADNAAEDGGVVDASGIADQYTSAGTPIETMTGGPVAVPLVLTMTGEATSGVASRGDAPVASPILPSLAAVAPQPATKIHSAADDVFSGLVGGDFLADAAIKHDGIVGQIDLLA